MVVFLQSGVLSVNKAFRAESRDCLDCWSGRGESHGLVYQQLNFIISGLGYERIFLCMRLIRLLRHFREIAGHGHQPLDVLQNVIVMSENDLWFGCR